MMLETTDTAEVPTQCKWCKRSSRGLDVNSIRVGPLGIHLRETWRSSRSEDTRLTDYNQKNGPVLLLVSMPMGVNVMVRNLVYNLFSPIAVLIISLFNILTNRNRMT